jgi:phosphoglycolate phosphatase
MGEPKRGLLIFDLDGTLFRTDICSVRALESVFHDHALGSPPTDEWIGLFGQPNSYFVGWLEERAGPGLGERLLDEIAARELAMVPREGKLYAGVMDALTELRPQVEQMAICSNGPEPYVRTVLSSQGLDGLFDAVRWRRDGDISKVEMLKELLARLSGRPAIVIGDRSEDIAAAHANGALAIGVAYGFGGEGEVDEAEAVVLSPAELPSAVAGLLGPPSSP